MCDFKVKASNPFFLIIKRRCIYICQWITLEWKRAVQNTGSGTCRTEQTVFEDRNLCPSPTLLLKRAQTEHMITAGWHFFVEKKYSEWNHLLKTIGKNDRYDESRQSGLMKEWMTAEWISRESVHPILSLMKTLVTELRKEWTSWRRRVQAAGLFVISSSSSELTLFMTDTVLDLLSFRENTKGSCCYVKQIDHPFPLKIIKAVQIFEDSVVHHRNGAWRRLTLLV